MIKYKANLILIVLVMLPLLLSAHPASAQGEYRFDFATKVAGIDNYTKHWSNTYPPDPKAEIIVYSAVYNASYKRLSALNFVYVTYDPFGNIVAVDQIGQTKRNYEPNVVYYTLHPGDDWIEGNYKISIVVLDRIDRDKDTWENINTNPVGIASDLDKYKKFYETGSNAQDVGVLRSLGFPVAQAVLNFKIDKSVTIYPPDRFLLHDVQFVDNNTERIIGEKLKIEVMIDNNYKDDGAIKLALLVDNNLVSTQDVVVKGLSTSTVLFDAKAGKLGTFKLHFGTDTKDVKYRNAELMFSIKNEAEATKLDLPKITITGMNIDKEFVGLGDNVTVSVTVMNNGKTGNKTITVYSNRVPVGSVELRLQYLEEKTVEIPIRLENMGINKITISDAPQLFRNVFVQESESSLQKNPVTKQLQDNPLKVSMVVVFMVFAGVLYRIRKRLQETEIPIETTIDKTRKHFDKSQKTLDAVETTAKYKLKKNLLLDIWKYLTDKKQYGTVKKFAVTIKLRLLRIFNKKAARTNPESNAQSKLLKQEENVEKPPEMPKAPPVYEQISSPIKEPESSEKKPQKTARTDLESNAESKLLKQEENVEKPP